MGILLLSGMDFGKHRLAKVRAALLVALDAKLKGVPEWEAFREIDDFLQSPNGKMEDSTERVVRRRRPRLRLRPGPEAREEPATYADLALRAIADAGKPVATPALIAFIAKHRSVPSDPQKAKMNITSGLSRDPRLHSIPWQGGRGWWVAGVPVPDNRSS